MREFFECIYSRDVKEMDLKSAEVFHMPSLLLMENAGRSVADFIESLNKSKVAIICGKGNNGGDGLVVARQLLCLGKEVKIFYIGGYEKSSEDVRLNMEILKRMNADISFFHDTKLCDLYDKLLFWSPEIIIDAVFGIGFKGELKEDYKSLFENINSFREKGTLVVSVDIPSGINGDTGQGSSYVKADYTITFQNPKTGHFLYPGREASGKLIVKNISAPYKTERKNLPKVIEKPWFQKRNPEDYKGTFGHVGIVGGSFGMTGAGVLAALGALRSGAGIVSVASPVSYAHIYAQKLTETITYPVMKSGDYRYILNSFEELVKFAENKTSLVIGPGMGREEEICELILKLLPEIKCNMVVDADAIYALSRDLSVLEKISERVVLTPHYGEMSFLTGLSVNEIKANKIEIAKDFSEKYGVNMVLKGADSIICLNNGEIFINQSGSHGMGSGGSGDVLAGMISACIKDGFDFVADTVFIHGKAGEIAAKALSATSMTSLDIPIFIGEALKLFMNET